MEPIQMAPMEPVLRLHTAMNGPWTVPQRALLCALIVPSMHRVSAVSILTASIKRHWDVWIVNTTLNVQYVHLDGMRDVSQWKCIRTTPVIGQRSRWIMKPSPFPLEWTESVITTRFGSNI